MTDQRRSRTNDFSREWVVTSIVIKVLEVTEYPPNCQPYKTNVTPNPSWEQVESAIRALDHHRQPFIFIGLRDECQGEDCLSVLGGPNGYAISAADSDSGWLNYCDPSHTGGDIPVW